MEESAAALDPERLFTRPDVFPLEFSQGALEMLTLDLPVTFSFNTMFTSAALARARSKTATSTLLILRLTRFFGSGRCLALAIAYFSASIFLSSSNLASLAASAAAANNEGPNQSNSASGCCIFTIS